jgi:hypothetical protein
MAQKRIDVYYGRTEGETGYKEYGTLIVVTAENDIQYGKDVYEEPFNKYRILKEISDSELLSEYDQKVNTKGWITGCLKETILARNGYGDIDAISKLCDGCPNLSDDIKQCSRCRTIRYCSIACQTKNWPFHKRSCTHYAKIALVTLQGDLYDFYNGLLASIQKTATLVKIYNEKQLADAINDKAYTSYIIADIAPSTKLIKALEKRVREDGCFLLFGLGYSDTCNIKPFETLGLPWKRGDYYRTVHELKQPELLPLPLEYSAKGVTIRNVGESDWLYAPVDGETTEPLVLAAYTKLGNGTVAYSGDVNNEEETVEWILKLLLK